MSVRGIHMSVRGVITKRMELPKYSYPQQKVFGMSIHFHSLQDRLNYSQLFKGSL